MTAIKLFFTSLLLILTLMASAQTLNDIQCKNRILLVMEQGDDTPIFQNQLDEFDGLENEMEERKILMYQIKNNSYRLGLHSNNKWKSIKRTQGSIRFFTS